MPTSRPRPDSGYADSRVSAAPGVHPPNGAPIIAVPAPQQAHHRPRTVKPIRQAISKTINSTGSARLRVIMVIQSAHWYCCRQTSNRRAPIALATRVSQSAICVIETLEQHQWKGDNTAVQPSTSATNGPWHSCYFPPLHPNDKCEVVAVSFATPSPAVSIKASMGQGTPELKFRFR